MSVRALDLPGHGGSPPLDAELLPGPVATAVVASLPPEPIDLLVGHSLGALVALEVAAMVPGRIRRLVLEEPPGPLSLDFETMAAELECRAREARDDPGAKLNAILEAFPRWHELDCLQTVCDLVRCNDAYVAAGLRRGTEWRTVALASKTNLPTLLLLAPDSDGLYDDREDGTALRRGERKQLIDAFPEVEVQVVDCGHCVHRDASEAWLEAVTDFA